MKNSGVPNRGVWQKDWTSFLSERRIPESEKYLVLATWDEGDEGHSCRYPVRATSIEDAIRLVKAYDKAKDRPLFTGADNVNFAALVIEMVQKSELDYLVSTDRNTKMIN